MKVKLYSYFRSSCSYRVRIALYLKKIDFVYQAVHLLKDGGEQHQPKFTKISPLSQLPCLEMDGKFLYQSLPIILYLEDKFPQPALLPKTSFERMEILSFCESINSFIQPLQNFSVLKYVEEVGLDKKQWTQKWINKGFDALEKLLQNKSGSFCFGNNLSCADLFLIPQVYNAKRFEVNMDKYPLIQKIENHCLTLEAFQKASPSKQPDS